jgi:hypothetical protein
MRMIWQDLYEWPRQLATQRRGNRNYLLPTADQRPPPIDSGRRRNYPRSMRLLPSLIFLCLVLCTRVSGTETPAPVKPPVADAAAEYALGIKCAEGSGVPKDHVKAIRHFRKAAELGDARAQDRLGTIFANGEGVPKDFIEGLAWYNIAAADGSKAYVDHRNSLEHQIGVEATLVAQRRSKQILEGMERIQPTAVPPPQVAPGQAAPVEKPKEATRMSYKEYLAKHPAPDAATPMRQRIRPPSRRPFSQMESGHWPSRI